MRTDYAIAAKKASLSALRTLRGERLFADGGERRRRSDRLRIGQAVQDRRLARRERPLERRRELLGPLDTLAVTAERFCIGGEIRVLQRGRRDAARIVALLVHADGAIHGVVEKDHEDRQVVLHGGGEFLPVHE